MRMDCCMGTFIPRSSSILSVMRPRDISSVFSPDEYPPHKSLGLSMENSADHRRGSHMDLSAPFWGSLGST